MGIVVKQFPFFMQPDEILLVELIAAMPSLTPNWSKWTGRLGSVIHRFDRSLLMVFAGEYANDWKYHVCHSAKAVGRKKRRHFKTKEEVINYIDKHF